MVIFCTHINRTRGKTMERIANGIAALGMTVFIGIPAFFALVIAAQAFVALAGLLK
jgi:hypothetical protein